LFTIIDKKQEKFENTKWVVRSYDSKKNRHFNDERENTKEVVRSYDSKKDRHFNDQRTKSYTVGDKTLHRKLKIYKQPH
jgi:hypothetical protein